MEWGEHGNKFIECRKNSILTKNKNSSYLIFHFEQRVVQYAFLCFFLHFLMSKKLIAALSLSLVLAACNTTADVTVDGDMDSSASSSEALVEDSSASSVEADASSSADVEVDAEVEAVIAE